MSPSFAAPGVLVLLAVLLPPAAWLLARAARRRELALQAFGDTALLGRSSALPDARRRRRRDLLLLVALGCGLVALARPQYGRRAAAFARTGRDVLVALDLSRSMTASDLAPTRLAHAKRAVLEAVNASRGDRVGLLIFGGSAFLQLPLTDDHQTFRRYLDAAVPEALGDPGTDLSRALAAAAAVFEHDGERGYQAVLVVSDGESHGGDLDKAIQRLRKDQIPVFTIGIGSRTGAPVPADKDEAPEKWHRDHIGRVVSSRLEEAELRTAAARTGGAFVRWTGPGSTRALTERMAHLRTRTLDARKATERADQFGWPLGLAFLALAAELLLSQPRLRGPANVTPRAATTAVTLSGAKGPMLNDSAMGSSTRMASAPSLALRVTDEEARRRSGHEGEPGRAGLAGVWIWPVLLAGASALSCAPILAAGRKGDRLYNAARWKEAFSAYAAAIDEQAATPDARLRYNAGTALYRMRRYEEAARLYRDALATRDIVPPLRQRASYNLGNALVRMSDDKPGDPVPLRAAISAYEESLRIDPADQDAKWNLELAVRRLGEDRTTGGSPGFSNRGDYGRGNQNEEGYEGNPETAVGAMAGGGYGAAEGESAEELDPNEARQLLDAVEKEELQSHEGRPLQGGGGETFDW